VSERDEKREREKGEKYMKIHLDSARADVSEGVIEGHETKRGGASRSLTPTATAFQETSQPPLFVSPSLPWKDFPQLSSSTLPLFLPHIHSTQLHTHSTLFLFPYRHCSRDEQNVSAKEESPVITT
jgi:hypothetical protein